MFGRQTVGRKTALWVGLEKSGQNICGDGYWDVKGETNEYEVEYDISLY